MTQEQLYGVLRRYRLGVLGTIGPEGTPQSAIVGIAVTPRIEIIFDTVRRSRKYANLAARPECSFVIGGWNTGQRTIQFEGVAEETDAEDLNGYRSFYFETWPDGRERMTWPGIVHFVVRPRWVRYTEYGSSRPLIQEFSSFGPPAS